MGSGKKILVGLSRSQKHKRWKNFNVFKHCWKGKSVLFGTAEGGDDFTVSSPELQWFLSKVEHRTYLFRDRKPKKPFLVLKLACVPRPCAGHGKACSKHTFLFVLICKMLCIMLLCVLLIVKPTYNSDVKTRAGVWTEQCHTEIRNKINSVKAICVEGHVI